MSTIDLTITGMTCQHCVGTVTSALAAVPHVKNANVDLESGRAHVETDGAADIAQLVAAVAETGYEAHAE